MAQITEMEPIEIRNGLFEEWQRIVNGVYEHKHFGNEEWHPILTIH